MTNFESDSIQIQRLSVPVKVGETSEERAFPQLLNISIQLFLSLKQAGQTDILAETVDYAAIIQQIKAFTAAKPFNLIESVAEGVSALVLQEGHAQSVRVTVEKKAFPDTESVQVSIVRSKRLG